MANLTRCNSVHHCADSARRIVVSSIPPAFAQTVHITVSSKVDRLSDKPSLAFRSVADKPGPAFRIDEAIKHQTIAGFGASFLEAGLIVINSLPPEQQESVLRSLFDAKQGADSRQ